MEPLMNAMGIGPFFTLLGGFVLLTSFMSMFLVRKYGMEWRQRREEHEA
jgi:UPF0716 family protein affecting phage T7 exclusion